MREDLYDKTSPTDIEAYGKKMIGKTMRQIYKSRIDKELIHDKQEGYLSSHEDKNYKGGIGNLIEECWFGYAANSDAQADFSDAGVELKVTPYMKTSHGFRAKERLVLTMINYMEIVKERDFEHSHLWEKAQLILLVWYLHAKGISDMDSTVDFVQLFTPPPEDLAIIRSDYQKIITKIKAGKAHELSEGDTLYLGACTKSSNSKVRRQQPFSDTEAKPRAFSFKNSYMTYILLHYIMPGKQTYEPIVKEGQHIANFERYVTDRIARYRGASISNLAAHFQIASHAKNIPAMLAFRILGVTGNNCEEFEKAGIAVKTIRIQRNGRIRENMSFPSINYRELARENWEDCTFGNYLRNTRFFFVIYHEDSDGEYRLQGGLFWNMPAKDLEGDVRAVWQETHDIISRGQLSLTCSRNGTIINNLPKKANHPISHVRPHARTRDDTSPLPEGTHIHIGKGVAWSNPDAYTKHCFWLNNNYILRQIKQAEN